MSSPPWDFSDPDVTFDNPGFTFDGGSPGITPPPTQRPQLVTSINHTSWLLDWESGGACLDANGNIAVAGAPYAIAQDVATQLSTFRGEPWYDSTQGVPYWQQVFGKQTPASLVTSSLEEQALLVPDVATAAVTLGGVSGAPTTQENSGADTVMVFDSGAFGFNTPGPGQSTLTSPAAPRGIVGQVLITDTDGNAMALSV